MTNPNVIRWIGSAERLKLQKQSERPFHQDEKQFYLFHPPMPTENWKQLQEYFDERTLIEDEKIRLKEDERKLVDKYDDLRRNLAEVQKRPASTPEEEQKKQADMEAIQEEIKEVAKKIKEVKKEIQQKEEEIDRVNEKINEMIEIVIEDEHKLAQQEQELEKEKNDKKVEDLINQL